MTRRRSAPALPSVPSISEGAVARWILLRDSLLHGTKVPVGRPYCSQNIAVTYASQVEADDEAYFLRDIPDPLAHGDRAEIPRAPFRDTLEPLDRWRPYVPQVSVDHARACLVYADGSIEVPELGLRWTAEQLLALR